MTTTNHALTGAMIATVIKQPYLAIPLAFLSHFFCDAIPHFGIAMKFRSLAMYVWLLIDGLVALAFAAFLIISGVDDPVVLAVAGFAAMSPDLAWLYYGLKGVFGDVSRYGEVSKIHSKIQWYQKPSGILIEIVWALSMTALIFAFQ